MTRRPILGLLLATLALGQPGCDDGSRAAEICEVCDEENRRQGCEMSVRACEEQDLGDALLEACTERAVYLICGVPPDGMTPD